MIALPYYALAALAVALARALALPLRAVRSLRGSGAAAPGLATCGAEV